MKTPVDHILGKSHGSSIPKYNVSARHAGASVLERHITLREAIMLKCHRSELLALSFGAVFAIAISPNAFAQSKKLSYEQAWAQCKSEVNRTVPGDQASARTSAGGACMHKYGYRLKKKK